MRNDQRKMKKSAVIVCLLSAGLLLLSGMKMQAGTESRKVQTSPVSARSSRTGSQIPDIPEYCIFAGDTIRFDNDDMRERLDRELIAFTFSHSTSILMLKRAPKYFPIVEPVIRSYGMPDDIKYLMVIESNLDPRAVSTAGAAGLWQFTEATGRQYGLEVNSNIDERYNIEKATAAALKYLKAAYGKYGDWLTVAASYNAGQNRISSEIVKQREGKAVDLLLPNETSRYIFRLLAAKMMFENPQAFGFTLSPDELYRPTPVRQKVETTDEIPNLVDFAEKYGTSYYELKNANPWLREDKLKNSSHRQYIITIPDVGK